MTIHHQKEREVNIEISEVDVIEMAIDETLLTNADKNGQLNTQKWRFNR
jgi:hypothetical protein